MKKYLLFLVMVPLVIQGMSYGPKSGERPRAISKTKPVRDEASAKLYSKETLRSDLSEIKDILISNHPAPWQFSGKDAFDNLYREQLQKINRPMNLGEYFLIAAPLVEAIHCGHTWISLPDDYWDQEGNLFFPLGLIFSGDRAYAALTGNQHEIPPGSEIICINKIPVSDIVESTKRLVNSDAKSKTGKLAIFGYSYPDLFALQYGNSERYETNFVPPGTTEIKTVTLKPVSRKEAWENPVSTLAGSFAGGRELQLEIAQAEKVAVLTIRSFSYYDNKEKFYAFIDSAFDQIHRAAVQNLILDLRNNSGGDPYCAVHLICYLETKPAPYFARVYEGYESMARPIPVAQKNVFSGSLFVLINGGCFSTTGHLCSLLKYAGRCKFIGEETGGTYECNDSHIRLKTSATKMNLNVARMTYTAAVKGISRETGIMPDYSVEPTIEEILSGHDAVMGFAKKLTDEGQEARDK
jgi:hypothetical protein